MVEMLFNWVSTEFSTDEHDEQTIYDKKIHFLGIMLCRFFDKNATSLRE